VSTGVPPLAATALSTKTQATTQQAPLALTDDPLDQIMRHAAVLHPQLRRVFVEHGAYELRGMVIGDGVVSAIASTSKNHRVPATRTSPDCHSPTGTDSNGCRWPRP